MRSKKWGLAQKLQTTATLKQLFHVGRCLLRVFETGDVDLFGVFGFGIGVTVQNDLAANRDTST